MELSEILRIHELWVKWFTWKKYSRDSAKNRKQSRQILLVAPHLLKFLGIFKAVEQKGDPNQMIKIGLQHSICFGIIKSFCVWGAFNFMKVQLSVPSYNSNECTYISIAMYLPEQICSWDQQCL